MSFRIGGVSASSTAFADDIILTAATPGGLQSQLDLLHDYLQERWLEVNANKCRTLTIITSGKEKSKVVTDRSYTVGGEPIEATTCNSTWKYLGIQYRGVVVRNDTERNHLAVLFGRLAKAPLKPQQRVVALRFRLIPRMIHRLVPGPISAKLLLDLDRVIRSALRR
ncbi:hypothetical protein MTO96_050463 [Rhipicephalus appendiculatus]